MVDRDGDGLIEIDDPTMLHNMRYNLAGTSYKTGTASVGNSTGCPSGECIGYELTGDLDFDRDGNGRSWSGGGESGYLPDEGDSIVPYFDVAGAGGWQSGGSITASYGFGERMGGAGSDGTAKPPGVARGRQGP